MITIETPNDLPHGIYLHMILVKDEVEAQQITGAQKSYLFKSKIIDALYLFVPVLDGAA